MPAWLNLPNTLTLLRLACVPVIIAGILRGSGVLTVSVFALAAITDVLDGALARRWKLGTRVGAYLDPIADKCLLSGVFLALAAGGQFPWWLVAVIFGRDVAILAAAALIWKFTGNRSFPPSVWGKASTFVQIVTATSFMAHRVLQTDFSRAFSSAMLWPCAAFTVWSGVHYAWRYARSRVRIVAIPARE
jgi:cardiolipin synthase